MDTMTREDLKLLAAEQNPLCLSLYHPLHRRYPHTQENQTLLREALDEAQAQLVHKGLINSEIERVLGPARELLERDDFWEPSDARGLAVFVRDNGSGSPKLKTYRLPFSVSQRVDVGTRFHVTPLVGLLDWDSPFHLLALGQNSVRLYACNRKYATVAQLPPGIPESFEQFTAQTDSGKPTQSRVSARAATGGREAMIVHGQTTHKDEHKARVHEFVAHIGKELNGWLSGRTDPVILAAVDSYHPIFQKACPYPYLVAEGIHGSPDELTESELHKQATERVSNWRKNRFSDFNGRFTTSMAHGHASCEIESIVPAAFAGRVESLLLASGETIWGRCDPNSPLAIVSEDRTSGDVDLLDLAIGETLAHGGEVHSTDSDAIPGGSAAAALLRW